MYTYTYMYMYIATVRSRGSLGDFWSNNVNICAYYICDSVCVHVNIYYKKIKTMFPPSLPPYSTCTCTCACISYVIAERKVSNELKVFLAVDVSVLHEVKVLRVHL